MATATETLLTAEQFGLLPDKGKPCELVKGRIVEMNLPRPRHGQLCIRIGRFVGNYVEDHDLGHVLGNDSGVITERDPDTVRGPDISYFSYERLPRGPLPNAYPTVAPELVFEIRSPTDRMNHVINKITEYINAGVLVGCIVDDQTRTLTLYRPDSPPEVLTEENDLTLPDLFGPEFRVPVRRVFAE